MGDPKVIYHHGPDKHAPCVVPWDGQKWGTTVRTMMLFDYGKAFDFIDHSILVDKLCKLDISCSVVNWIIDFLSDRSQRIKLAEGCFSE